MKTVTSNDGATIAFDEFGAGPPVVMAAGAFNDRSTTEPLARGLAPDFMVVNYDRRGRGDSGDGPEYAVEREIEDLAAIIAEVGGSAAVFGYSSGANLVLKAAASGLAITRLVLYEPAFVVDDSRPRPAPDMSARLGELIAADRRGEAVELFQTEVIGMPAQVVAQMRHAPFRPGMEAIAHTLAYDATIVGDLTLPAEAFASITAPTLVLDGEDSPPVTRSAARAVADTLPGGRLHSLAGQGHTIEPNATASVIAAFLSDEPFARA
jgi:pimeloyl-ACP methyl ester carboxylesterase